MSQRGREEQAVTAKAASHGDWEDRDSTLKAGKSEAVDLEDGDGFVVGNVESEYPRVVRAS